MDGSVLTMQYLHIFEGGSVGSALAILLLYPLERARVELQSKANDDIDDDWKPEIDEVD